MTAFYDWNILLDEVGGPNHVKNFCDAPFLFDGDKKELIESNILSYIGHFSQYIMPGAVRIGYSKYTDKLEVTAFETGDKTIVAVVLNQTKEWLPAVIRLNGQYTMVYIQPESISTAIIS
jgi:glucosylceramidase